MYDFFILKMLPFYDLFVFKIFLIVDLIKKLILLFKLIKNSFEK